MTEVKNFNLIDPVYKNGFIFLYGTDKQIIEYANKNDLAIIIEPEQGGFCLNVGPDCYIWIRDMNLGDLVHECIHATQYVMDYRGISTDINNTEVLAYHTQWLFDNGADFYLKEFNKKAKGK